MSVELGLQVKTEDTSNKMRRRRRTFGPKREREREGKKEEEDRQKFIMFTLHQILLGSLHPGKWYPWSMFHA
jgi:hypothetical protein